MPKFVDKITMLNTKDFKDIEALATDATSEETVAKVNEILETLKDNME